LFHPQRDRAEWIDLVGNRKFVNYIRIGYIHIPGNIGVQIEPCVAGFARRAPVSGESHQGLWMRRIGGDFSDERVEVGAPRGVGFLTFRFGHLCLFLLSSARRVRLGRGVDTGAKNRASAHGV
jgi:hypothetical protein